ncbi:hypothetical protein AB0B07_28955 [Streptomyces sioyaensis]|uniref:hypothetical protein n=1 Tax=Streptomyces sioyaensis TaxID=67364 RepID=UPI00340B16A8
MNTPSPVEAREALARARQVRLNTAESVRTPWWLWAAISAVLAVYTAAWDFGPTAQMAALFGYTALNIAWYFARRFSPRFAAASGALHLSALPKYAYLPALLIILVVVAAEFFAGPAELNMLTGSDMPAWIRDHPCTTLALPNIALGVALGLLNNMVVRRMARRGAVR